MRSSTTRYKKGGAPDRLDVCVREREREKKASSPIAHWKAPKSQRKVASQAGHGGLLKRRYGGVVRVRGARGS